MNDNQNNRDWGEESAVQPLRREISVVLCEPGKQARTATIEASLESYQNIVGGYIEAYYPFEEPVCIVCNEEGRIRGLSPSASILRMSLSGRTCSSACRLPACSRGRW